MKGEEDSTNPRSENHIVVEFDDYLEVCERGAVKSYVPFCSNNSE